MNTEGSAFLDRTGRVIAADETFRLLFAESVEDPGFDLSRAAEVDPSLRSFLSGAGPDRISIGRSAEGGACVLSRVVAAEGVLLHACRARSNTARTSGEDALLGASLGRLARGFAHEMRSPLNAMSLQVALLSDKLGDADRFVAEACASNFESLRSQIARLNDMVRRYVEVTDPGKKTPFDAGALLCDVAQSFAHEVRRRGFVLQCEAIPDKVAAVADPRRTAALLFGSFWGLLDGMGDGGRLIVRAVSEGSGAVLSLERHGPGLDGELSRIESLVSSVADEMGGRFDRRVNGDVLRVTLTLPKERST